jgi:uncharacterized protein involved in outer membrane biogenesis
MRSKRLRVVLIGGLLLVVALGAGLFLWARAVLAGDGVRTTVESQLTRALGQPVTIGRLGVSIFPRVTMDLSDVTIGKPARITIRTLHVGTAFRALLSRRIERADLRVAGARIELPLPPLGAAPAKPSAEAPPATRPPVELVSIDEIALADVEVVSGGRTLRADVAMVPHGAGVTIRRLVLSAGPARVTVTGEITSLAGPTGDLALTASGLNVLELAAFVTDFSGAAGLAASASAPAARPGAMNLAVSIDADRASFGALTIERLKGRARVTSAAVTIDPIAFGVFDGTYDGAMTLTPGRTPTIRLSAKIAKIDVASAMTFAGTPGQITGRAAGTLDLTGRGTSVERLLESARGTARLEVTDGTIAGLGLVRTVVLAGSMREASQRQITAGTTEPFSRLAASFDVAAGEARTDDLRFESKNLLLSAVGGLRLDGRSVEFAGPVQLSDELSKQAGQDLLRYTQKDGRVTIPVTVSGPVDHLAVRVGMTELAKRAIANRASEELKKGILKGLRKIIK